MTSPKLYIDLILWMHDFVDRKVDQIIYALHMNLSCIWSIIRMRKSKVVDEWHNLPNLSFIFMCIIIWFHKIAMNYSFYFWSTIICLPCHIFSIEPLKYMSGTKYSDIWPTRALFLFKLDAWRLCCISFYLRKMLVITKW
jgi:hypothetical protein